MRVSTKESFKRSLHACVHCLALPCFALFCLALPYFSWLSSFSFHYFCPLS